MFYFYLADQVRETGATMIDEFEEIKRGFLDEAEQCLSDTEQCFLHLEKDQSPEVLDKLFRLAHNIKGSANAVGFSELGAFTHELETLLLKIKKGEQPLHPPVVDLLLRCNDHIILFVSSLKADMEAKIDSSQLLDEIRNIGNIQAEPVASAVEEPAETAADAKLLQAAEMFEEETAPTPEAEQPQEIQAVEEAVEEIEEFAVMEPVVQQAITQHEVKKEVAHLVQAQAVKQEEKTPAKSPSASSDESIRVSLARLEGLINCVGELVILQSVLKEQTSANSSASSLMKKTVHQLGKVTKEVQNISMGLRMIPMKQTYQKMQRIVRDTSRALAKEINFETVGDDTELDKTVLEQLGDPLVHLVRNAVDHGIESAEARVANGKSPVGTVKLKSFHRVGQIVIEVSDDGKGLDGQSLINSAIKKGLLKPGTKMTEEEAHHIVFMPGFSTKEVVTDVSGRGVGMDVVKTNIDQLRGTVQIFSTPGQGTCFQITLPLTLSIIDTMIVSLEKQRYVIPLHHVYESVEASGMRTQTISESAEVLLLRGENIPFYRLGTLLGRKPTTPTNQDGCALIIRNNQSSIAVFVDAVIGQSQAVIKPLGAEVRHIKGFSGSAILGDGLPAVILDLMELVRKLHGSSASSGQKMGRISA